MKRVLYSLNGTNLYERNKTCWSFSVRYPLMGVFRLKTPSHYNESAQHMPCIQKNLAFAGICWSSLPRALFWIFCYLFFVNSRLLLFAPCGKNLKERVNINQWEHRHSHSLTPFAGICCNSFEHCFEIVAICSCKFSYLEVRSVERKIVCMYKNCQRMPMKRPYAVCKLGKR